jgi:hypothetical protein
MLGQIVEELDPHDLPRMTSEVIPGIAKVLSI